MTENKDKIREIVRNIGEIIGDNPDDKREFLATLLDRFDSRVPAELLDRENLPHLAASVITERDIHNARMSLPPGTMKYTVRDPRKPRKMNAWIGPYDELIEHALYKQAVALIMSVKEGGLVTRSHNRPVMSDKKVISKIAVPPEDIDSIWFGIIDDDTVHPREALKISTSWGREFIWDPESPEDPDDAASKKMPGGKMTVRGGVPRQPGYGGMHILDQEQGTWVCTQNIEEQQFIRGGMAPQTMEFNEEPQPAHIEERVSR